MQGTALPLIRRFRVRAVVISTICRERDRDNGREGSVNCRGCFCSFWASLLASVGWLFLTPPPHSFTCVNYHRVLGAFHQAELFNDGSGALYGLAVS